MQETEVKKNNPVVGEQTPNIQDVQDGAEGCNPENLANPGINQGNVDEALNDAVNSTDNNNDSMDEAADKFDEGKGSTPGVLSRSNRLNGATAMEYAKTAVAAGTSMAASYQNRNEVYTYDDFDKESRNDELANQLYIAIETEYTREKIDGSSDQIKDEASGEAEAQLIEDTAVIESVAGVNTVGSINSGLFRENGRIFVKPKNNVFLTGKQYIRASYNSDGRREEGQTKYANVSERRNILLNAYDEHSKLRPEFRAIRRGLYLVKGYNINTSIKEDIILGYVQRKTVDVAAAGDAYDKTVYLPVKVSGHNFFDVIDLTAVMEDVHSAERAMAKNLTAIQSRLESRPFNAVGNLLETIINTSITDDKIADDYPEFFSSYNRSTLISMDGSFKTLNMAISKENSDATNEPDAPIFANVDVSCYNDMAEYSDFMDDVMQSEVILTKLYSDSRNKMDHIKAWKNLEGRTRSFFYFNQHMLANPRYTLNSNLDLFHWFSKNSSVNQIKNYAAWMRRNSKLSEFYGKYRSHLDDVMQECLSTYLQSCAVYEESVNNFFNSVGVGKLTNSDGSSNNIIQLSPDNFFVIGYNPNDLISLQANGMALPTDSGSNVDITLPFFNCGYTNVKVQLNSVKNYINIKLKPLWMDYIVTGLRDRTLMVQNLVDEDPRSGSIRRESAVNNLKSNGTITIPLNNNLDIQTWESMFHMSLINSVYVMNTMRNCVSTTNSAISRWYHLLLTDSFKELKYGANRVNITALIQRLDGFHQIEFKSNVRDSNDIEPIKASRHLKDSLGDQIGNLYGATIGEKTKSTLAVFMPHWRNMDLDYLTNRLIAVPEDLKIRIASKNWPGIQVIDGGEYICIRHKNSLLELVNQNSDNENKCMTFVPFNEQGDYEVLVWNDDISKTSKPSKEPVVCYAYYNSDKYGYIANRKEIVSGEHIDKIAYANDPFSVFYEDDYSLVSKFDGELIIRRTAIKAGLADVVYNDLLAPIDLCGFIYLGATTKVDISKPNYRRSFIQKAPVIAWDNTHNGDIVNRIYKAVNDSSEGYLIGLLRNASTKDHLVYSKDHTPAKNLYESDKIRLSAIPSKFGFYLESIDDVSDYTRKEGVGKYISVKPGVTFDKSSVEVDKYDYPKDCALVSEDVDKVMPLNGRWNILNSPEFITMQHQTVYSPTVKQAYPQFNSPTAPTKQQIFDLSNIIGRPEWYNYSIVEQYHSQYFINSVAAGSVTPRSNNNVRMMMIRTGHLLDSESIGEAELYTLQKAFMINSSAEGDNYVTYTPAYLTSRNSEEAMNDYKFRKGIKDLLSNLLTRSNVLDRSISDSKLGLSTYDDDVYSIPREYLGHSFYNGKNNYVLTKHIHENVDEQNLRLVLVSPFFSKFRKY